MGRVPPDKPVVLVRIAGSRAEVRAVPPGLDLIGPMDPDRPHGLVTTVVPVVAIGTVGRVRTVAVPAMVLLAPMALALISPTGPAPRIAAGTTVRTDPGRPVRPDPPVLADPRLLPRGSPTLAESSAWTGAKPPRDPLPLRRPRSRPRQAVTTDPRPGRSGRPASGPPPGPAERQSRCPRPARVAGALRRIEPKRARPPGPFRHPPEGTGPWTPSPPRPPPGVASRSSRTSRSPGTLTGSASMIPRWPGQFDRASFS